MEIVLDRPHVTCNEIKYRLRFSGPLRKYFINDAFCVRYDSGVDLRDLAPSILTIPLVALTAPIAWAVGADVRLNAIDATYLRSLATVKDVYRSLHSNFSFSGDIRAERAVSNEFCGDRTGMLFTGGVDSLTSYLRHREKKPDLISVWGLPDIYPFEEEFGDRMWSDADRFARLDGLEVIRIKTDMISNLNRDLLAKEFGLQWFRDAAFGLFLLGLCAPVTAARKIETVIIAAGRTQDCKGVCGSLPSIDNNVAWADVGVIHDGYEISRQQKIQYLCAPENVRYLSALRVCWEWAFKKNCGNCEKCMRTIAGLAAGGVDPGNCNFDINETTFPHIKNCFRQGKIALGDMQLFMWRDVQKHIPERVDADIYGSREFLTWLKGYDLSKYKASRLRNLLWEANHLSHNGRINTQSVKRKLKCYFYIARAKLGHF